MLWQSTVLTSFIKKKWYIYFRQRTQGYRAGPQYVRVEPQSHRVWGARRRRVLARRRRAPTGLEQSIEVKEGGDLKLSGGSVM